MRKSVLLSLMAAVCVVSIMPSYAATSSSSSGGIGDKMKNGAKAVGRGIAYPFKKMGAGMKAIGNKMHGGSSSPKKSSP